MHSPETYYPCRGHLDDDVGLRDVDGRVSHFGQADAIHQRVHSERAEDARPLALRRCPVDVRDS